MPSSSSAADNNNGSSAAAAAVIKAAKKILKKSGGGSNLDELVKVVIEKKKLAINSTSTAATTEQQVVEWIQKETKKFSIDGNNIVTLKKKKNIDKKNKKRKQEGREENETEKTSSSNKKIKVSNDDDDAAAAVAADDISSWRKDNKIILAPTSSSTNEKEARELNEKQSFFPFKTFDEAMASGSSNNNNNSIAPTLIRHCTSTCGFERPSPIQAQAWPILAQRRDVVGIAETGSGKTLAFCLPALTHMVNQQQSSKMARQQYKHPKMLILSPTRELAMQIDKVLQEFGAVVGIKSIVLYGGVPKYTQTTQLKRGNIECVVATPGRLKDLIQENSIRLDSIEYLVLDEADRMLDLGFEQDVRFIISKCKPREDRQTAMFSATWPAAIQDIASEFMTEPVRVYVGFEAMTARDISDDDDGDSSDSNNNKNNVIIAVDDSLSANKRVKQNVEVIDDAQRPARLRAILSQVHKKNRVLVFALYKKEAERLEYSLKRDGYNCCSIHGNKQQAARTQALEQFRDGSCPLLIATDVAARGLDIPNVEAVINYTFPLTIEDYVHRIGRTGRAGKYGASYTFFQPSDKARAGELQAVIRQVGQEVPNELLKFGSTIKKKEHKLYGNFGPRTDGTEMKKASKITFNYSDDEE